MTVQSAFSRCLIPPEPPVPPVDTSNKWNPGNYIGATGTMSDTLWAQMTARLNPTNDPNGHWKGVLNRYTLPDFWKGDGVYDFSELDARLSSIATYAGRRLIPFFNIKTFGGATVNAVPAFLRTATYADAYGNNGQYAYGSQNTGSGGNIPNFHVASVKNAIIDFFTAMGAHYANGAHNGDYIEAIAFSEASIVFPNFPVAGATTGSRANIPAANLAFYDAWFAGAKEVMETIATVFPRTQVCQWINAPRNPWMKDWVPTLTAAGIGVGMPDNCPNDAGFLFVPPSPPGNIYHCQQGNGAGIVMVHHSKPAQLGSVASVNQGCDCCNPVNTTTPYWPGPAQTRQAAQDHAVQTVGATHVIWAHVTELHSSTALPKPKATDPNNKCNHAAIYTPVYPGVSMNSATDAWIHNVASNITTVTARPTGW